MDLAEALEWVVLVVLSQGIYDFARWLLANHLAHRLRGRG